VPRGRRRQREVELLGAKQRFEVGKCGHGRDCFALSSPTPRV
jgi:hypothetical protein